jgi:hypothetical protein
MSYKILAEALRPTADAAIQFLKDEWGIPASRISVETEFHPEAPSPTIHATDSRDHTIIAIEVSNSAYPPQLDKMVLDCMRLRLPVHLYVAMPAPVRGTISHPDLARAKAHGVGVLIVNGTDCKHFERALALSLIGADDRAKEFPKKYRHVVSDAHMTFVTGDPDNGCLAIYKEIEFVGRKLAAKATRKGWWKDNAPTPPGAHAPWKSVASFLANHFDAKKAKNGALSSYLLAQVDGTVGRRNSAAHKPKTVAAQLKRHKNLRNDFETGVSTLLDLVRAARI